MWSIYAVSYAFLSLVAVVTVSDALADRDRGASWFVGVWVAGLVASGIWILLREPRRIEAGFDGLLFVAPAKTILIPWESLRSVSSRWLDRQSLYWKAEGRRVHTWGPYDRELEELLAIVRERAPAADVRGAVTTRPTWGRSLRRRP